MDTRETLQEYYFGNEVLLGYNTIHNLEKDARDHPLYSIKERAGKIKDQSD
jgi:hypothetical protein